MERLRMDLYQIVLYLCTSYKVSWNREEEKQKYSEKVGGGIDKKIENKRSMKESIEEEKK